MQNLFKIFEKHPEVLTFFSERADGDMRLKTGGVRDTNAEFARNRAKYFERIQIPPERVISALLVHGTNVRAVSAADAGQMLESTDGLTVAESGIYLSITVADCLPIFFYDPVHRAVGLVHAGWRGLSGGIISNAVEKFRSEYGSDPSKLLVAIGPGIGDCHYEIQEDLEQKFVDYPEAIKRHDDKTFLDLKAVARKQLAAAGILYQNVEIHPDCTADFPKKYFSFRRDKPKETQAMLALIGLKF